MRMVDLIELKKDKGELTKDQIDYIIKQYCLAKIPDYQMSALLMAICFNGLNEQETFYLTKAMLESGEQIDLKSISKPKVDKHSTGGVGDKTTLVLAPMVAALDVAVAKMSGKGLGHTGGTLDKLASIPNLTTKFTVDQFIKQVEAIGIIVAQQSETLVPADKKLYALRDVTATVASLPLIASSIMSKKLAVGNDAILLDVKYGNGAFMKTRDDAVALAQMMIKLGKAFNKDTRAIISNMNQPLGNAIGNNLEVIEAINTLKGNGPKDLHELCLVAGSIMLLQTKRCHDLKEARTLLEEVINNGQAFNKLKEMVMMQGGDTRYLDDSRKFATAKIIMPITAKKSGYVAELKAMTLGLIAMKLGGGRETIDAVIDSKVGIVLNKKVGDKVNVGDVLGYIHANDKIGEDLITDFYHAYKIVDFFVEKPILIEQILV